MAETDAEERDGVVGADEIDDAAGARGVPGPGEMTIASGFSASSASGSKASLRTTRSAFAGQPLDLLH